MNSLDVLKNLIIELHDVKSFTFSKYPKQTLIQNTVDLSEDDKKILSSALLIRENLKLPFWDSLMLSCFDKENVSLDLLNRALLHNSNKETIQTRDIAEIEEYLELNPEENISLNSIVLLNSGEVRHLFLLDFHIFPSDNNLEIISKILYLLDLHGYVLNSGESYHFISNSLYDEDMLLDLLAKSLLFSPVVDRAWIAHQLLERSCSIRVGKKHGLTPHVNRKV